MVKEVAFIVPKLIHQYTKIDGVRTYLKHLRNIVNGDIIITSPKGLIGCTLDEDYMSFDEVWWDNYSYLYLIDAYFYEKEEAEFLSFLEGIKLPKTVRIHGPDSIRRGFIKPIVNCDNIIFARKGLLEWFKEKYQLEGKHEIIPLPFYSAVPEIEMEEKEDVAINVTRFTDYKEIERIILAGVVSKYPIRIMGNVSYTPQVSYANDMLTLSKYIPNTEVVIRDLSSEEVFSNLKKATIFLSTTRNRQIFDAYGIEYAAMEAMVCKCAIIADIGMKRNFESEKALAVFVDTPYDVGSAINVFTENEITRRKYIEYNLLFLESRKEKIVGCYEKLFKGAIRCQKS